MELNITLIEVDSKSLEPALLIHYEIEYDNGHETPLSIAGRLSVHDKIVANIGEYSIQNTTRTVIATFPPIAKNKSNKDQTTYSGRLIAGLSPKALDFIEECREKDGEKAIHFNFKFIIRTLEIISEPGEALRLNYQTIDGNGYHKIQQSDWVRKFSPALGIGNFLLLEFEIPDKHVVDGYWKELYDRMVAKINEVQDAIRNGEWLRAMERGRQFYEIIKPTNKKKASDDFEKNLAELFKKDGHNEDGFKDFMESQWKMFEYCSKFLHEKDKDGNFKKMPAAHKEDAYLVYTLGIGLINVIGRKMRLN